MYTILNDRSVVKVTGEDKFKFFQGLITNDINKLTTQSHIYACMLTPQGKYFADLFLSLHEDVIWVDLPSSRIDEILKKLMIYRLRSKVEFALCPEYKIVAFIDHDMSEFITDNNIIFNDPRSSFMGKRGYVLSDKLLSENPKAYDSLRIDNFIAEGEKDLINEQSFILEYGLDELNAIDYNKGCYVGQELVARTHHRGVVRKQIAKIESFEQLPALRTNIYSGEKKLGIICSSVGNKGLGLIRVEDLLNLDPAEKITADNIEIKITLNEKAND